MKCSALEQQLLGMALKLIAAVITYARPGTSVGPSIFYFVEG